MIRHLCICFCLALVSAAIPLRAANGPHAGTGSQTIKVWTNDDLESLQDLSPICIVGRVNKETPEPASLPQPYINIRDPEWYAEQAARLRDELERRKAQLNGYRQTIEDARRLKTLTGGINLDGGDVGITPEAGIEILEQRVMQEQAKVDDLEDLARRNEIVPGTLRGQ